MIGSEVLSDQEQDEQEEDGEEDYNEDYYDERQDEGSDTSEDSQDIEPAVLEDMEKFRDTFKGISKRFRLINRIGEGKLNYDIQFARVLICL